MDFLWLKDRGLKVLFENDEILAVDKPYGIDTHTNESKDGQADLVQPGLIELFEKQRGKLHIVHRLDRTTTGAIVFAKTLESAKKYQGYFRARETKKTYLFVTASSGTKNAKLGPTATRSCNDPIVRNGAELEASTDFKMRSSSSGHELWEAHPHTGRNHQIRIHASAVGLPLLGDSKYGGETFPFICLHNSRIEFPDGVVIESPPPAWFKDLSLLKNDRLVKALFEIDRRQRLFSNESECVRLVHPGKKGPAYALDQFGSHLVLSWYGETWTPNDAAMFEDIAGRLNLTLHVKQLHAKARAGDKGGATGSVGAPDEAKWVAQEGSLKHELRMGTGQAPGLFLDQRLQREWLVANAKSKSILNLFSYTGGFSVAAALGGATEIVSVDSSKAMLNWARENFALNGIDVASASFLCRDVVTYLDQAASKNLKFDLVICDAPSFSRGEKTLFKIEEQMPGLIRNSLKLLNPGGSLLFSVNAETIFADDIRRTIEQIKKDLKLSKLKVSSIQPSLDFELPGEGQSLKSFLISNTSP